MRSSVDSYLTAKEPVRSIQLQHDEMNQHVVALKSQRLHRE